MLPRDVPPLLSLVVPTRNRQKYAINLLHAIRVCDTPELEVILQDNSDDPTLGNFVSKFNDHRIRYFYCSDRLSMNQNFDLAIDKASGDFVCTIGDDDGIIVSRALASLRKAKARGANAMLTGVYSYSWPGVVHRFWGDIGGSVSAERLHSELSEQLLDPASVLNDLFARGSVGGLGLLPRVYQGYISRASLIALKDHCGTYFPGSSPDIANAVALIPFVDSILFDPTVTIISGHSPRSGGGLGSAGQHHDELEHTSHILPETIRNWDPAIPRFWSGTTIYAQSAVEAARAIGLAPSQSFNYTKVCVACLIYQPAKYRKHVHAALRNIGAQRAILWSSIATECAAMVNNRVRTFFRNLALYRLGGGAFGRFDSVGEMMNHLASNSDSPNRT